MKLNTHCIGGWLDGRFGEDKTPFSPIRGGGYYFDCALPASKERSVTI